MAIARAARFRRNVSRCFARISARFSGGGRSVPLALRFAHVFAATSRNRSGPIFANPFRRAALRRSNV